MTLYEGDLAHIHASGFTSLAEAAGRALPGWLRAAGVDGGLVVDLGCGNGVTARALAAAGYEVLGIDSSEAMLRIARPAAPGVRFRAILVETSEDRARLLLTQRITTFRRTGGGWRRGAETHRLRLHRPSEVAGRLRTLGCRVRIRRGYAGARFAPGHYVVIARR